MKPDSIQSINPATLEVLGEVPVLGQEEVLACVAQARRAQPAWQGLGFQQRRRYLFKIRDVILDQMDSLAECISKENGKPVFEAITHDILPVMDLITHYANHAEKIVKKQKVKLGRWFFLGRRSHLEFYPRGVVGIISPWNFPFSIPLGEVVMALMAGNAVVLKPSEFTSRIGQKIQEIIQMAGLPVDVFHLVTGFGETGAALVNSGCDMICFTGSVGTGKRIMETCAKTLTPLILELGGKDPFLVFEDADLDAASSAAVWGAFCNSGQVCASVERVYVQESVFEEFKNLVVKKTKMIRQGVGLYSNVDMGCMTSEMQINKVESQVQDARTRGAKILCGGERNQDFKGYFYRPTVLVGVDHSFPVLAEETFGPILPLMKFQSEKEAILLANDTEYALNAYLWGKDRSRLRRVASQIVAGTVNINESVFTHSLPQVPWGGIKKSGMGRTHGSVGFLDLMNVRHVHENLFSFKQMFVWWYGYSQSKIELFQAISTFFFGTGMPRFKALFRLLRLLRKVKVD